MQFSHGKNIIASFAIYIYLMIIKRYKKIVAIKMTNDFKYTKTFILYNKKKEKILIKCTYQRVCYIKCMCNMKHISE